jgi:hypothetical protein
MSIYLPFPPFLTLLLALPLSLLVTYKRSLSVCLLSPSQSSSSFILSIDDVATTTANANVPL